MVLLKDLTAKLKGYFYHDVCVCTVYIIISTHIIILNIKLYLQQSSMFCLNSKIFQVVAML